MCETARYSHRGILPGWRICIELVELGSGNGMGMESLLGKGHMVFPERFLHVMHQMDNITLHFAQSDWLIRLEKKRERSEVSSWGTFHVSARRLFSIQ